VKSQPDFEGLQDKLGYRFSDPTLLQLALTHPSVSHESSAPTPHNQRLEFLGDAVLGLILTKELYEKFPAYGEGPLTKARAQMVNRRTLSAEARRLNLGDYLILSRGEEANGGRQRLSSLADAFEALLGAIFLDGGYEKAKDFTLRCFGHAFGELTEIPNLENPKGELQEMLQVGSANPPDYKILSIEGPDHDRVFECVVSHHGVELGRGKGKSKKTAESAAAAAALAALAERKGKPAPTTKSPEPIPEA